MQKGYLDIAGSDDFLVVILTPSTGTFNVAYCLFIGSLYERLWLLQSIHVVIFNLKGFDVRKDYYPLLIFKNMMVRFLVLQIFF